MNPLLKEREVAYYLDDSQARLMVRLAGLRRGGHGWGGSCRRGLPGGGQRVRCRAHVDAPGRPGHADRADDDTAVILYTSGTTGQPKGAELTHANLATNVEVFADDLFRLGPEDLIFGGLPLFHSFGQTCGLNAASPGPA